MLALLEQVLILRGQKETVQLKPLSDLEKTVKILLHEGDLSVIHVVQQVRQVLGVHVVQAEMQVRTRALLQQASEVVTARGEDDSVGIKLHKVA